MDSSHLLYNMYSYIPVYVCYVFTGKLRESVTSALGVKSLVDVSRNIHTSVYECALHSPDPIPFCFLSFNFPLLVTSGSLLISPGSLAGPWSSRFPNWILCCSVSELSRGLPGVT